MLWFFLKRGGGAVPLRWATPPGLSSRQMRPGSAAPALPSQPCNFTRSPSPRVAETPSQRIAPFPPPPARHFLSLLQSPFPYSAHHHLLSRSGAIPKAANEFSPINGFLHLSSLPLPPQKTKQRKKPFPSPLRKTTLGAVYYFYCISRHTVYNLISICEMSES